MVNLLKRQTAPPKGEFISLKRTINTFLVASLGLLFQPAFAQTSEQTSAQSVAAVINDTIIVESDLAMVQQVFINNGWCQTKLDLSCQRLSLIEEVARNLIVDSTLQSPDIAQQIKATPQYQRLQQLYGAEGGAYYAYVMSKNPALPPDFEKNVAARYAAELKSNSDNQIKYITMRSTFYNQDDAQNFKKTLERERLSPTLVAYFNALPSQNLGYVKRKYLEVNHAQIVEYNDQFAQLAANANGGEIAGPFQAKNTDPNALLKMWDVFEILDVIRTPADEIVLPKIEDIRDQMLASLDKIGPFDAAQQKAKIRYSKVVGGELIDITFDQLSQEAKDECWDCDLN